MKELPPYLQEDLVRAVTDALGMGHDPLPIHVQVLAYRIQESLEMSGFTLSHPALSKKVTNGGRDEG